MGTLYFTTTHVAMANDGHDGKSGFLLTANGNTVTWATEDDGATGTLTSDGPIYAFVGVILYIVGDVHGSGQYQVDAIISNYEVTMTLYNGDGVTANDAINNNTGPFRTIAKLMQTVTPGDQGWIKDGTYTAEDVTSGTPDVHNDCIMYLQTVGAFYSPIVISGFKNVIGDLDGTWGSDDRPLLDADSESLANCILSAGTVSYYYTIKHLRCSGASSNVIDLPGTYRIHLIDCKASDSVNGDGIFLYGNSAAIGCVASGNHGDGIDLDSSSSRALGCDVFNNGAYGVRVERGASLSGGKVYGNTTGGVYMIGVSAIDGVTIDGNGAVGIRVAKGPTAVVNSLIYNSSTAIYTPVDGVLDGLNIINTIIGKYTTKYSDGKGTPMEIDATDLGAGATWETFGFAAADDYRLLPSAPGAAAAMTDNRDIGCHQRPPIGRPIGLGES